jgi:hypothetical protein
VNLQKVPYMLAVIAEQTPVQVSRQVSKIDQIAFIGRAHLVTEGTSG